MAQKQWANSCCNPFNNQRHKKSSLRPVLPWMGKKIPNLTLEEKICDNCRKKLSEMEIAQYESSDDDFQHQDLKSVNKGLALNGGLVIVSDVDLSTDTHCLYWILSIKLSSNISFK